MRGGPAIWLGGAIGVLLCAVGAVFIGQGVGAIHGSMMTGHSGYAALGAVLVVVGIALLVWAWRMRAPRT